MRRLGTGMLIAGIALVLGMGCGRYGKPVRTFEQKPAIEAAPGAEDSAESDGDAASERDERSKG